MADPVNTYFQNTAETVLGRTTANSFYQEVGISGAFIATNIYLRGTITHFPPAARNPYLDIVFDCSRLDNLQEPVGILTVTLSVEDHDLSVSYIPDPVRTTLSIEGSYVSGDLFAIAGLITLTLSMGLPDMILEAGKGNWVRWSNIGKLDFTVWKDNVAGERPLDWAGWAYKIKKLVNKVLVYGQSGISFLAPNGTTWGLNTVSRIGIKTQGAVCGTDFVHFYIDVAGRLCKVEEGIEILGYEEYLNLMLASLVMSYDELNQMVYICDGSIGYVYSVRDKSLGEGPKNITGIGHKNGTLYITSYADVETTPFEICTDIADFGTRKNKTIMSIDVGTDLTNDLYAAIDYRNDKTASFATTPWMRVNHNGVSPIVCFGVEFRFRLKTLEYEQFELDYLRVNGAIHNSSFLDVYARERGI